MRSFRALAAGAVLAGGLSACSLNQGQESDHSTSTWTVPVPDITPTTSPTFETTQADTLYIDTNAGINLIYLEPDKLAPTPAGDDGSPIEASVAKTIVSRNPALLKSIQEAFLSATYGRYDPKSVSVTAGKIALGCISNDNEQMAQQDQQIQSAAATDNNPEDLNIVIVDQYSCAGGNNVGEIGGFETTDGTEDPTILRSGLTDLNDTILHETGHDGGLNHAGTANCREPVTVSDCSLFPVDDPSSVMDYPGYSADEATQYSYPELGMLGLLKSDEVLTDPKTAEYTLTPMGVNGLKVIVLKTDDGKPVYISFEADSTAGYDEECRVDPYGGVNDDNLNDPYFANPNVLLMGQTGNKVDYVCLKINIRALRNSVQVRIPEYDSNNSDPDGAQEYLADITRKPRIPNAFDPHVIPGTTMPSVIYTNSRYSIEMVSISNEGAVLRVIDIKKQNK